MLDQAKDAQRNFKHPPVSFLISLKSFVYSCKLKAVQLSIRAHYVNFQFAPKTP